MKRCLIAVALLLAAGCQHPRERYTDLNISSPATGAPDPPADASSMASTNTIDPAWLQPPTELFTLGPGDRLELEIIGEPLSRTTTIVAPDGKIYFNLLPGVDVWGLTLIQAKARIERELAQYVRQQPQVSIVLREVESKRFWMLGRIQAPGVYPLAWPTTVLEAISLAGGTMSLAAYRDQEAAGVGEELADLQRSFIIRGGKLLPVDFSRLLKEGDLSQNIYLQPDDFIFFPAAMAREVYVLGAVAQPRPVPYHDGLTVAGAVANAYGTINGAYLAHVAVVRGSLSHPQIQIVDYKHVIRGTATDIRLQPRDIVYVPYSPYRYISRYIDVILNTFVSSVAINAGARAVGGVSSGSSIFIPVGGGAQITPPASPPPIH
jgi:protein involved in polysaccharide export with SLBB domain